MQHGQALRCRASDAPPRAHRGRSLVSAGSVPPSSCKLEGTFPVRSRTDTTGHAGRHGAPSGQAG
eukprot:5954021-Prymnesium_polylepis.1